MPEETRNSNQIVLKNSLFLGTKTSAVHTQQSYPRNNEAMHFPPFLGVGGGGGGRARAPL